MASVIGPVAGRRALTSECMHVMVRGGASRRYISADLERAPATRFGSDCTISIGFSEGGAARGGHWRFVLHDSTLYAGDEASLQMFAAGGRWRP
jgi:hypothetical protein